MSYRNRAGSSQNDEVGGEVRLRTNFRCAAQGCPNAASIDDRGESNPGKCFFHWSAPFEQWASITRQIRADESMRNHGLVPVKSAKRVQEERERYQGPRGMRTVTPGTPEVHHFSKEDA